MIVNVSVMLFMGIFCFTKMIWNDLQKNCTAEEETVQLNNLFYYQKVNGQDQKRSTLSNDSIRSEYFLLHLLMLAERLPVLLLLLQV